MKYTGKSLPHRRPKHGYPTRFRSFFPFISVLELEQQCQQPTNSTTDNDAGRHRTGRTREQYHAAACRGCRVALGGVGTSHGRRAVSCWSVSSRGCESCRWSGGRGGRARWASGCEAHHSRVSSCCLCDELDLRYSHHARNHRGRR